MSKVRNPRQQGATETTWIFLSRQIFWATKTQLLRSSFLKRHLYKLKLPRNPKGSREVISCTFEPEGNACSLTDSTAEEHVLALVEHAADEARDRISRLSQGARTYTRHRQSAGPSSCPPTSAPCPTPPPPIGTSTTWEVLLASASGSSQR
ncbi:uncharacterized protein LOC144615671 isoform X1 [Panthera onca]